MGTVVAVDVVSFNHESKETLALVGETGCGKSVIASSILKLLPDNANLSGEILYGEKDLLRLSERELADIRGQEISIIFQNPTLALNPVYRIGSCSEFTKGPHPKNLRHMRCLYSVGWGLRIRNMLFTCTLLSSLKG